MFFGRCQIRETWSGSYRQVVRWVLWQAKEWICHNLGVVKIAMICPYSLGYPGGVQSQVVGLSESMRKLGHEVELLAPCDDLKPP